MKLIDAKPGTYVTRHWYTRSNRNMLRIYIPAEGAPLYIDNSTPITNNIVYKDSSAWRYTDFELCDSKGNILTTKSQIKEPQMNHTTTKIIVTSSDNTIRGYVTEAEAIEAIAAKLEEAPRTKFTMFKPYQLVEPKVPDLSALIRKIG